MFGFIAHLYALQEEYCPGPSIQFETLLAAFYYVYAIQDGIEEILNGIWGHLISQTDVIVTV